eukprot:EG_transcript_10082
MPAISCGMGQCIAANLCNFGIKGKTKEVLRLRKGISWISIWMSEGEYPREPHFGFQKCGRAHMLDFCLLQEVGFLAAHSWPGKKGGWWIPARITGIVLKWGLDCGVLGWLRCNPKPEKWF